MTGEPLLLHLGPRPPRLAGLRPLALPRRNAEAVLAALDQPPPWVLLSLPGMALPEGHTARLAGLLAGQARLALGLEGAIYPDLFEGLAETIWRPDPASLLPEGCAVNELALAGLGLAAPPLPLLRALAALWQGLEATLLPWLGSFLALELHRAGWRCRLLPGPSRPAPPGPALLPPAVVRAVLEYGGLRHLAG